MSVFEKRVVDDGGPAGYDDNFFLELIGDERLDKETIIDDFARVVCEVEN